MAQARVRASNCPGERWSQLIQRIDPIGCRVDPTDCGRPLRTNNHTRGTTVLNLVLNCGASSLRGQCRRNFASGGREVGPPPPFFFHQTGISGNSHEQLRPVWVYFGSGFVVVCPGSHRIPGRDQAYLGGRQGPAVYNRVLHGERWPVRVRTQPGGLKV